jgi:cytoskeletal protein CcmA (bactofilin family)
MRFGTMKALGAALAALALAGSASALDMYSGERLRAHGAYPDAVFLAGGEVTVSLTTPDDLFVAARDLRVDGAEADHMFLGGADVLLSKAQARDIIAAGGDLTFEGGTVADDVVAAAGRIRIRPGFEIGGSALLAGGQIDIEGSIGGELVAAGGTVTVNGVVGGDVELSGERLVIGPRAKIGGDLSYAGRQIEIAPSAVIEGRRIQKPVKSAEAPQRVAAAAIGAMAVLVGVWALGGALAVVVAGAAFPGLMRRAAERIETRPLPTIGLGFLLMIGAPVAIALMFVTVVGIPTALLTLALYIAAAPLALAAVTHFLAEMARRRLSKGKAATPARPAARFGWSLLALLALTLLGLTPFVGGLVWLVAYVTGLGAVMIEARRALAQA